MTNPVTPNMSLRDELENIDQRIRQMEERFSELGYNTRTLVQTEMKTKWKIPAQAETIPSLHTAIVIETIDPWKQGRVRFFSPHMHDPGMAVKQMPWAYPISNMGGFDDSGCTWVPPAGSKLCILFEKGNRQWPFYVGTTWDRDRGPDGNHKWNYPVEEYYKIHEGHRRGYMVGKNDGSQVFPPWNTENYNGYDVDSLAQFENDPEAKKKITYPNIYGFKTPQRHMLKMVDGNYKCNFRWSRIELKSGQGNLMIFKDDHLHPAGQWVNPQCCSGGGDVSTCNDENGNPLEKASCPPDGDQSTCANPYHKHISECSPYRGPGTPQNNKVDAKSLPQSGMQMLTRSGHTMWMDDSVEQPRDVPRWERGPTPFDWGCTDLFTGKIKVVTATGHVFEMNDKEKRTKLRGDENYIRLKSASGSSIEINDDSVDCECAGGADRAGPKRGITMQSTSRHIFQMIDENNEQCGPCRAEGGIPKNKATNAFVKVRTGYGLEIHMGDDNHQEDTQKQYIQITAPQYDACCGPHIIRMQEDPNCGQIFIRSGGDYILMTEGDHYTVVGAGDDGDEDNRDFCEGGCLGPRNKIVMVSQHSIHYSCNFYFNIAEIHAFLAEQIILLMAGKDCKDPNNPECGPCVWPVVVLQSLPGENGTGISRLVASDRVFASASLKAPCCHIYQLLPFTTCGGPSCEEQ